MRDASGTERTNRGFCPLVYRHLSIQTLAKIFNRFILDKRFSPLYIVCFGDFNQQETALRKLQR